MKRRFFGLAGLMAAAGALGPGPAQQAGGALVLSGGDFIHPALRAAVRRAGRGADKTFLTIPTASSGIRLESGFEYEPADGDSVNPRDAFSAYLGTQVERELQALVRRGGVLGGNSAGAIIQGSFIVRGGPTSPSSSRRVAPGLRFPSQCRRESAPSLPKT
ncbi:MAG: hypothetical protein ABI647_07005 [Gemmatimonadota bacterium]